MNDRPMEVISNKVWFLIYYDYDLLFGSYHAKFQEKTKNLDRGQNSREIKL